MDKNRMINYIREVLERMPTEWLLLTTHRLDIYNEELAKVQFLEQFEKLFYDNNFKSSALSKLPTAYDYIRLGHPLSCILEWVIANLNNLPSENVISFSSKTIPLLAVLRKNSLDKKGSQILYTGKLPEFFNAKVLRDVYGYKFDLKQIEKLEDISDSDFFRPEDSIIFISQDVEIPTLVPNSLIDFHINFHAVFGSVLMVNGEKNEGYIPDIQHVRRRETIAMTPANCFAALRNIIQRNIFEFKASANNKQDVELNKTLVLKTIADITDTKTKALLGSSGLSIQYAIMMGLVHNALENHKGKAIKFVVPPNCYGGTNDQARRVAASIDNVEIVDLPVDGNNDMVKSLNTVLDKIAIEDAVPYIIAEIPTNPRVEVPDLIKLKDALSTVRKTASGNIAIDPVFILDQTFCPNVRFLGDGAILSTVRTISYISGSKFPSGGLCNAGFTIGNKKTEDLMAKIELHLRLCDNEATDFQVEILAKQMPSMIKRIDGAYRNTREFVNFISEALPEAKINFVSEELAAQGFTPSVFSLDLPTKGNTEEEKESYKRALNHKLINLMITEIPNESKHCVSYGQLRGCYWTIPATSTQGTTKEGDKDYIARVALSPNMDLELHKKVFADFVREI